jgi:hypothetical protein
LIVFASEVGHYFCEAYQMSDVIVSKVAKTKTYKATQGGRKIAEGKTQNEAAWNAHKKVPKAPILAQRVKTTDNGFPDEFRRIYPTKSTK